MMHKTLNYALMGCLLMLFMFPPASQAQTVIRVVGNHTPPARIIQNNTYSGYCFDLVHELAKRLGTEARITDKPFKRSLELMKVGEADMMCGPNKLPEREVYMDYTSYPLPPSRKVFLAHPDSPGVNSYEDLHGKQILSHIGKSYFDRFDNDGSLIKVPVSDYNQAIRMILRKRADILIITEPEADYRMKQSGVKLKKSAYKVEGRNSYITISKHTPIPGLFHRVEKALENMDNDGTIEEILNRYR